MRKQEFISSLRKQLACLPRKELEERLNFYSEMIDDKVEEGCLEEDAIAQIGSVETIAGQILTDAKIAKLAEEKTSERRRLKGWEIALLALGSPIWLSLIIAAFAVILSLYVTLWALVVSIWAVFVSLIACALGGAIAGIVFCVTGKALAGLALLSAGFVCAGLAIFLIWGCKAATRGAAVLPRTITRGIKNRREEKEEI